LKLPVRWKVHPVFHVSKLLAYRHDDHHHPQPPPPDLIEGELEQEVEDILNERVRRGKKQYLVKWKGFPMEENEWMSESDLRHAKDLLDKFKARKRNGGARGVEGG
jgi:hypothetical protein